ncbi:MAG TPA: acyltransferase [Thermoanaerobaculia bacterium]
MIRGLLTILLLAQNLALWGIPVLTVGMLKFVTFGRARRRVILALARLAEGWVGGNNRVFDLMLPVKWEIEGLDHPIRKEGHYLIISNHVSWVDIFALFRLFHGKVEFLRFFLKQELIWLPIAGQACWALEFPFMKRYTPQYLEKHPEKRGEDLKTTRIAMERYRTIPVAILNFIEGTRFSEAKRQEQRSPYKHLLRPRTGGLSFVLASLGDQLDAMFDVTIAYPQRELTFWEFVTGRVPRIIMHVRQIEIPAEFRTKAVTEHGPMRGRFKKWLDEVWREKDALIERLTVFF